MTHSIVQPPALPQPGIRTGGFFELWHVVDSAEIDSQNHVHNLRYLQWSLWATGKHTSALGHDADGELACGYGFVVREHDATYRQAALADDRVCLRTWIDSMDAHSAWRTTYITRPADQTWLVRVRTRWVYADLENHRLAMIPQRLRDAAPVLPSPPPMPWQDDAT